MDSLGSSLAASLTRSLSTPPLATRLARALLATRTTTPLGACRVRSCRWRSRSRVILWTWSPPARPAPLRIAGSVSGGAGVYLHPRSQSLLPIRHHLISSSKPFINGNDVSLRNSHRDRTDVHGLIGLHDVNECPLSAGLNRGRGYGDGA